MSSLTPKKGSANTSLAPIVPPLREIFQSDTSDSEDERFYTPTPIVSPPRKHVHEATSTSTATGDQYLAYLQKIGVKDVYGTPAAQKFGFGQDGLKAFDEGSSAPASQSTDAEAEIVGGYEEGRLDIGKIGGSISASKNSGILTSVTPLGTSALMIQFQSKFSCPAPRSAPARNLCRRWVTAVQHQRSVCSTATLHSRRCRRTIRLWTTIRCLATTRRCSSALVQHCSNLMPLRRRRRRRTLQLCCLDPVGRRRWEASTLM
ncbi:hypothetical protein BDV96DRAFT_40809 [Lophiotrema nucula]|uniref:Uncharacterized protein n=1 Tax=Lophiotrema nucula TaxID=690887 RepID=A0A6A5ZAD2_9PLEO|nr:hypothetical protein BDV96DRAFT_40809 [Lophiotrema nucula]